MSTISLVQSNDPRRQSRQYQKSIMVRICWKDRIWALSKK